MNDIFIDGQWLQGDGATQSSYNPFNGSLVWQGKGATPQQVDDAVAAARQAQFQWQQQSLEQRYQIVEKFTALLQAEKDQLAQLITEENGKPLWDARLEVAAMLGKAAISLRAYQQRSGSQSHAIAQGQLSVRHKALGVVAVFGPYNFPGHLANGHIIPALLAGNTLVFKPSEYGVAVAQQLVKLWQLSGIPNGVINMLQGDRASAAALAEHGLIDGLFFTGSASTGVYLHKQFAGQPEKVLALEMGGNNPLLIEPVKDIQAALYVALFSAFVTSGQRCTCARRLLLPSGPWGDQFAQQLVSAAKQLKVGDGSSPQQPFMGPLIHADATERLQQGIRELEKLGAETLLPSQILNPENTLMTPCIVDMTQAASAYDEELFGPVLQLFRYDSFEQALSICNNTRFGLAAGIVSDKPQQASSFMAQVRAGIINHNQPLTGASSEAPFGGVGLSGNGRPSAFYAADYCAYPVASIHSERVQLPTNIPPGISRCLKA